MSRGKTKKFAQNAIRRNVIQPGKELFGNTSGKWRSEYFGNKNPISIELACGRGEYTVGQARLFPKKNFIGVDIKGDRIWKGSGIAELENLDNAAFLRTQIQLLEEHFAPGEINEIWIVFPDPRPKDRDERRRITNPRFLEIYKKLVAPGSWIRLKTDNTGFFEYTIEVLNTRNDIEDLEFTGDLYASDLRTECFDIITRYEEKFHTNDNKIKYLKFRFTAS